MIHMGGWTANTPHVVALFEQLSPEEQAAVTAYLSKTYGSGIAVREKLFLSVLARLPELADWRARVEIERLQNEDGPEITIYDPD